MTEKLFNCAGITTHARSGVTVTKVRFGTDHIRLIKMLSSNKKISVSNHPDDRGDGFLDAVRVTIVELSQPMIKIDALKFLATCPEFQSVEDQATIQDEIDSRTPKAPRVKKEKVAKVKVAKKTAPTLDSIKSRAKKSVTVHQVLAAVTSTDSTTVTQ